MNEVIRKLGLYGIVPVVTNVNQAVAVEFARALCKGGLPVAEVTLRIPDAYECIKRIKREFPHMLVGAGTVLTPSQVDTVVENGAEFIVSPGLNPRVVQHCLDIGIPVIPGCANPSDVEVAIEMGLDVVKFFPAEAAGGLPMIKAMSAPYANMKFMPTGGLNDKNIIDYLKFNKVIACGGSYMVPGDAVKNCEWDKITELTRNALMSMLGFELVHVGINCENREKAMHALSLLETLFGFAPKTGDTGAFAGKYIELMYEPYLGRNGHVAIGTNFVDRAVFYFENMGVKFNEASKKYNDKGELTCVYFEEEIAGFAFHLVQKK